MNTLSYKTVSANKETVQKRMDHHRCRNQILGRLATKVANVLRGKHKPSFTPHVIVEIMLLLLMLRKYAYQEIN